MKPLRCGSVGAELTEHERPTSPGTASAAGCQPDLVLQWITSDTEADVACPRIDHQAAAGRSVRRAGRQGRVRAVLARRVRT